MKNYDTEEADWFVDLEILQDLMEDYGMTPDNTLADLLQAIHETEEEEGGADA